MSPRCGKFLKSGETLMRIGYGLSIFILFTLSTWAGAPYMAVLILSIALGWCMESCNVIVDELQTSLRPYLRGENIPKGAKPISQKFISTLVRKVKYEFIFLHCIGSFYHFSRTLRFFFLTTATSLYSDMATRSSVLHYGVYYVICCLKFYNFFTCMFYVAFLLYAIRNILQSFHHGVNDVILSYHVLALGAEHFLAFVETTAANMMISLPFIFGTFWTFIVFSGVAFNDACAYFIGRHFGKHPFSKISPKKTLEGYIGAGLLTITTLLVFTKLVLVYQGNDGSSTNFSISFPVDDGIKPGEPDANIFIHIFVISTFISTLSPLIGLFFSAIKRSLKKKDFATSLGPHGGFIDRFDCTSISAVFAYAYLGFIFEMNKK